MSNSQSTTPVTRKVVSSVEVNENLNAKKTEIATLKKEIAQLKWQLKFTNEESQKKDTIISNQLTILGKYNNQNIIIQKYLDDETEFDSTIDHIKKKDIEDSSHTIQKVLDTTIADNAQYLKLFENI